MREGEGISHHVDIVSRALFTVRFQQEGACWNVLGAGKIIPCNPPFTGDKEIGGWEDRN